MIELHATSRSKSRLRSDGPIFELRERKMRPARQHNLRRCEAQPNKGRLGVWIVQRCSGGLGVLPRYARPRRAEDAVLTASRHRGAGPILFAFRHGRYRRAFGTSSDFLIV
jgi:hypothetical protein